MVYKIKVTDFLLIVWALMTYIIQEAYMIFKQEKKMVYFDNEQDVRMRSQYYKENDHNHMIC